MIGEDGFWIVLHDIQIVVAEFELFGGVEGVLLFPLRQIFVKFDGLLILELIREQRQRSSGRQEAGFDLFEGFLDLRMGERGRLVRFLTLGVFGCGRSRRCFFRRCLPEILCVIVDACHCCSPLRTKREQPACQPKTEWFRFTGVDEKFKESS
jgi:hypothetical protein